MADRSSKRPRDLNRLAVTIVDEATSDAPLTVERKRGELREGGVKGGKARAAKLSPERRSEIARNAARARWDATDTTGA